MTGRLRMASGLVLFTYVVLHLFNHSLLLVSMRFADTALQGFTAMWRSVPGTVLLSTALAVHLTLALGSLLRRRTLRMSRWEWAQLLLGLSIVPLAMIHIVGTRVAHEVYEVNPTHLYVLSALVADPWQLARQFGLVLAVWLHACIGLHFYLRLKPWYPGAIPWLYAGALLLPTLAIAGAGVGIGNVLELMQDREAFRDQAALARPPRTDELEDLYTLSSVLKWVAAVLLSLVLLGRWVRELWARRRGRLKLAYEGGRTVTLPVGLSILEASRSSGIPHASVCGGRGRCSTCRVRVSGPGSAALPAPDASEERVLARLGTPQQVRLACQLRPPAGEYRITPLLPPSAQPSDAYRRTALSVGEERPITVMFVDLRGFTAFSEKRLPYDVVYLLNRYFRSVGESVEAAGGHVDKFIGDGVMALFGLEVGPQQAARQALDASRRIGQALAELNASLQGEVDPPLAIGIGLHAGPAIVGELGHGRAINLTAIGDTVNTASRLEALSKDFAVQLVVSRELAELAAPGRTLGEAHEVSIRGRKEPMTVYVVGDTAWLPNDTGPTG